MKITLNIPRNEYAQPTDPRPEVVQYIVNAFLDKNYNNYRIFHPVDDGYPRCKDLYIKIEEGRTRLWYDFAQCEDEGNRNVRFVRFYGCEMRAAMQALIQAGWHILEVYEYRTWKGYICCEKPYCDYCGHGSREIRAEQFTDFID